MRLHWTVFWVLAGLAVSVAGWGGTVGDFDAARWGTAYVLESDSAARVYCPTVTDGKEETFASIPAGGAVQVEWPLPRDVYAIKFKFAHDTPSMEYVAVSYWYRVWPDGGAGGWLKLDDPFNGKFVKAAVDASMPTPDGLLLRFKPLDSTENPTAKQTGADFRQTYKIRVTFGQRVKLASVECLTDSVWKRDAVVVDLGGGTWDGDVEGRNAETSVPQPLGGSRYKIMVRYADNSDRLSPDRGCVIVRRAGKAQDFSFFVDDVVKDGCVYVRDLGASISQADRTDNCGPNKHAPGVWDKTVIERVAELPEQTFERAMREIPRMWRDDAHMGLPVLRQEASIDGFNQVFLHSKSLRGIGADTDRSHKFAEEYSKFKYKMSCKKSSIGGPVLKSIKRWLEDGYLPIVHSTWPEEGIEYHQTVFVAALDPEVTRESLVLPKPAPRAIGQGDSAADFGTGLRGDEPIALLNKLVISNPAATERTAYVWFKPDPMAPATFREDGLLVPLRPTKPAVGPDYTPVWAQIDFRGKGEAAYLEGFIFKGGQPTDARDLVRYTLKLAPGETHTIYFKIPYIEQMTQGEIGQLKALDWEESYREVKSLWNKRLAKAISDYRVPEPMAENLYRANLWHVLIGTDRDPSTGLWEHGAGTYDYPMYANETMMVARMLEMRGEHEEARRLIEPYIMSQGLRSLPGNFKSKDGLLYAAAPTKYDQYTAQGYNMHHGFLLWAAAEHYLWTRDKAYLNAVAPNLIAACDWITRERQATKVLNPDGSKPLEYGLAPAGDLEDVEEYLYFYPTNAYYYLGMKTAADALADIGHPEADRIAADTKSYADDIMASVRESVATSPVVKLMDGSYIPYVPHRPYVLTDQKEGWIREALYCALHLESAGLIKPNDPMTTWVLNDLEDRIYMSDASGKTPEESKRTLEDYWFSLSGYNPQPNLLDNPTAYLQRGQIPNFVRAFFNIFSASLHPDTVCFAEGCPPYASGGCCVYKTPDESKFIQTMRQMLVMEMGDDLWIGRGVPKSWMADGKYVEFNDAASFFGPVSLKITSEVSKGRIVATVNLPRRNPPKLAHICFRHPEGKKVKSVTVNGKAWKLFDAEGVVTVPGRIGKVNVVANCW